MLIQVLLSGIALGSIYGLVALGFAVVFKATDVFNFAQGMFVAFGAFFLRPQPCWVCSFTCF